MCTRTALGVRLCALQCRSRAVSWPGPCSYSQGALAQHDFVRRRRQVSNMSRVRLQVAKVAESDADYRKFYLENGATTMRLRAETK